jgi:hypothetical protein
MQHPSCITEYNRQVDGGEREDQYLFYYAVLRNIIKWYEEVQSIMTCNPFPLANELCSLIFILNLLDAKRRK